MYKVFFNDNVLTFLSEASFSTVQKTISTPKHASDWEDVIHKLNSNKKVEISIIEKNPEEMFKRFSENFKVIEAGGGLVQNQKGEYLFIHRLGKWDLPKGKIEKNETTDVGAVREVEEECGISNPIIVGDAIHTYHTYTLKGKAILKKTYWYNMRYDGNETLVPQSEEDISTAVWKSINELDDVFENTYPSIILVLNANGIGNK